MMDDVTEDHRNTKKIKNFEEKALLPPVKSSPQNVAFPLSETKKKKGGRTLCIWVSPRRKGENTMYRGFPPEEKGRTLCIPD